MTPEEEWLDRQLRESRERAMWRDMVKPASYQRERVDIMALVAVVLIIVVGLLSCFS